MLGSLALLVLLSEAASAFTASALWEAWPSHRFVATSAPCLRHGELAERLKALETRHRGQVKLEEVGRSEEGRSIHLLALGRGPRRILLWSQMHGDEPSATPALLDIADFLLSRPEDPEARAILERLTLLMVPMLNPDGAERYERRNTQAIDINRDALSLVTPEGRLLKKIRDRYEPELGFNLHDQNRRTTVGETGVLATISLLAVAGDPEGTLTPGRRRSKRVCAAIATTLGSFVPGGIARYDEDWSPRAFGDNLTAWGTPVVLVESGGLPPGRPLTELTRLNFVALLAAAYGLAKDDLGEQDPSAYENLKRNQTGLYADVVLGGGSVLQPGVAEPYRADVAFDVLAGDRELAGCVQGSHAGSRIVEVGDARQLATGHRVDATGGLVVPGFVASVRGAAAQAWLDGERLDALGRLGVAAIRWHVEEAARTPAESLARQWSREGRPEIEVVAADAPEAALRLTEPPRAPASATLGAVLDALAGRSWTTRDDLAFVRGQRPPSRIAPGAAASLLVLRPGPSGGLDPDTTRLERVFLDGRELRR